MHDTDTNRRRGFHFPATAKLMLAGHTYAGEVGITNALDHYGLAGIYPGTHFFVKSTRPGNHHWSVLPVPGGFSILPCRMTGPGTSPGYELI